MNSWTYLCQKVIKSKRNISPWETAKTILTAGSKEERVIIAFVFNGRKRDNLDKVICFKFHIQERLRFHSLKGNKNTCDITEKSPSPPPTHESSGLPRGGGTQTQHSSRAGGCIPSVKEGRSLFWVKFGFGPSTEKEGGQFCSLAMKPGLKVGGEEPISTPGGTKATFQEGCSSV